MANRHRRSHLNISALWWMWSRPTFCAAASAKRAVLTTLTTAAPHCRAGTKSSALCSIHPGACRAAETGFGSKCWVWLHKQLRLCSFLRPPLLQTQPLWSPQLLIAQPFLAGVAAVQPVIAIQMGMCCLCQALICCKACRALYASTRLRCNESSINYCADNAPLIWMLSVPWKQQPSKASTAEHLLPSSNNWTNLVQSWICSWRKLLHLWQILLGWSRHTLCLSPRAFVAHRKGMIAGSMLGNAGNHRSNSLWSLPVMPHNLDIKHTVCSLRTMRYPEGQTLPLTLPSNSLKEFLAPQG